MKILDYETEYVMIGERIAFGGQAEVFKVGRLLDGKVFAMKVSHKPHMARDL